MKIKVKLLEKWKRWNNTIERLYELRTKEEKRKEKFNFLALVISFIPVLVIALTFRVMVISTIYILLSLIPPTICLFYKEQWDDKLLGILKQRQREKLKDKWNFVTRVVHGDVTEGMSNEAAFNEFMKKYNENLK